MLLSLSLLCRAERRGGKRRGLKAGSDVDQFCSRHAPRNWGKGNAGYKQTPMATTVGEAAWMRESRAGLCGPSGTEAEQSKICKVLYLACGLNIIPTLEKSLWNLK